MAKITHSILNHDISCIECTGEECSLALEHTDGGCTEISYPRGTSVYLDGDKAKLVIKQKRTFLSRLTGVPAEVKLLVPGHIVPSLCILGGCVDCTLTGGIFADVNFSASRGSISAAKACMESCTVNAEECDISLSGCTLRGCLAISVGTGDAKIEYTFATHISCRTGGGNIGAVELNCKDSIFETDDGNVTATVLGDESIFDVIVSAPGGTCNKDSLNIEGNLASFKAYAGKGNIFVDFIPPEKENSD